MIEVNVAARQPVTFCLEGILNRKATSKHRPTTKSGTS